MWIWLLLILLVLLAMAILKAYNLLRHDRETLKESFSNISVVISKKNSLVNQLIAIVQSYQESERFTVLKVSEDTVQGLQNASATSGRVIADIGRAAQRFPDLKSNQQYNRLMDALQASEQDVQHARTAYNRCAKVYNTDRSSIPAIFFARALGFGEAQYLSIATSEDASLRVQRVMSPVDTERLAAVTGSARSRPVLQTTPQQAVANALTEHASTRNSVSDGAEATQFCHSCGGRNRAGAVFCGACGVKL